MSDVLTASLEDYLEAIFHIIEEKQVARPKDIAKWMNVGNSSVTGALRALADKALINYAPYDLVTMTPAGKAAAQDVIRRHEVLRDFFIRVLAVGETESDKAACLMEHSVPKLILERFIQFAEFVETCPRAGSKWIAGLGYKCDEGVMLENCERCITTILEDVKQRKPTGDSKVMNTIRLGDMKPGQKGRVLKVAVKGAAGKRIVEMGVTPGSVIEIECVAPLGDPIDIKVKGYHLSLRKDEADGVELEAI